MMHYRILSYKPKIGDGKWLDNGIGAHGVAFNPFFWNKPQLWCSHKEIWDSVTGFDASYGTCWTSTQGQAGGKNRPKEDGVVRRPAAEVLKHPERWYFEDVWCDFNGYVTMMAWMHLWLQRNEGYNKADIGDFFNPFRRTQDLKKFICSGFSWAGVVTSLADRSGPIQTLTMNGWSILELLSPIRMTYRTLQMPESVIGNPIDLATGKVLYKKGM